MYGGEKKELRKALSEWRREDEEGLEYKERRTKYRETCERKREEENRRWEKKEEARRESEMWEIVNRERKRKGGISKRIEMEDWKRHFMRLLGEVEGRIVRGKRRREQDEREINKRR